jgi:glucose dehydrogenase
MAKWFYQMTPHDEWDYDGVNENILATSRSTADAQDLVHFDRNGFGYTLDRETGRAAGGREVRSGGELGDRGRDGPARATSTVVRRWWPSTRPAAGRGREHHGVCPAALGSKDQQPAAFSPKTNLFYVPTNHVCMDYEPFRVSYTAGQPYVGATLSMYPAPDSHGGMGNFIAWDAAAGEIKVVPA